MEDCTVTTQFIDGFHSTYYYKDGVVVLEYCKWAQNEYEFEYWGLDNQLHREDGPADIIYKNGQKTTERWYRNNERHRDGGPAEIWYENNQKRTERWYRNGERHRDGGPAEIIYKDSQIAYEHWCRNGKLHREDGPAMIHYEDGQISAEFWYCDGKLTLNGLLAAIIYQNIGSVHLYYTGDRTTQNIDEFRDAVKGEAIHDALRPLPIPIRQAIIPHYCYQ